MEHGAAHLYSVRLLLPRFVLSAVVINCAPLFPVRRQVTTGLHDQGFREHPDWGTWWHNYALDQTGVWQIITTGALVAG